MPAIVPYLKGDSAFDPEAIRSMSIALDDICTALNVSGSENAAREVIAMRVIELAQHGERDPEKIRDTVLGDAEETGRWSSL